MSAGKLNLQGMGAAWFRRDDWARWHELDPTIQPDFDAWLGKMEVAVAGFRARGVAVVKVMIDPDVFVAWADANGHGYDTRGRQIYAAMKAAELNEKGEHH
jgi:hypothetical protein